MNDKYAQTYVDGVFADRAGNLYSIRSGGWRKLTPCKVNNKRSKKQYWCTSYGLVHRLVASAFYGSVAGKVVNHLDADTSNNIADNLEIVSQHENCLHASSMGLLPTGESHGRAVYSDVTLLAALREVRAGCSVNSIAKTYGITQSYLNKVKNGVYRAHLGQCD
jgi:hypothetical protein